MQQGLDFLRLSYCSSCYFAADFLRDGERLNVQVITKGHKRHLKQCTVVKRAIVRGNDLEGEKNHEEEEEYEAVQKPPKKRKSSTAKVPLVFSIKKYTGVRMRATKTCTPCQKCGCPRGVSCSVGARFADSNGEAGRAGAFRPCGFH